MFFGDRPRFQKSERGARLRAFSLCIGKDSIMLLHLGENKAVLLKDVIMILNMETVEDSPVNQEFLEIAGDEKRVVHIAGPAKTLVLVQKGGTSTAYLSPVSGSTLSKRGEERQILYD